MIRNLILPSAASAATLLLVAVGVTGVAGCASDPADEIPMTEADAARLEAKNLEEKQAMLERADELVQNGEAERARGQAMVDQGNTVQGQPMIASGEAKIAQGKALTERANDMETTVEPVQLNVNTEE